MGASSWSSSCCEKVLDGTDAGAGAGLGAGVDMASMGGGGGNGAASCSAQPGNTASHRAAASTQDRMHSDFIGNSVRFGSSNWGGKTVCPTGSVICVCPVAFCRLIKALVDPITHTGSLDRRRARCTARLPVTLPAGSILEMRGTHICAHSRTFADSQIAEILKPSTQIARMS